MQIVIDGNPISAETGDMILDAAHRAGIDIPAPCRLPELRPPSTSCLVCLVKLNEKFAPSCAVPRFDSHAKNTALAVKKSVIPVKTGI